VCKRIIDVLRKIHKILRRLRAFYLELKYFAMLHPYPDIEIYSYTSIFIISVKMSSMENIISRRNYIGVLELQN